VDGDCVHRVECFDAVVGGDDPVGCGGGWSGVATGCDDTGHVAVAVTMRRGRGDFAPAVGCHCHSPHFFRPICTSLSFVFYSNDILFFCVSRSRIPLVGLIDLFRRHVMLQQKIVSRLLVGNANAFHGGARRCCIAGHQQGTTGG